MAARNRDLHLFEGYGIELEYMIVRKDGLDVSPICDKLLHAAAGSYVSDFEDGPIAWSNELTAHVVELKTNGPVASLDGLDGLFATSLGHIYDLLDQFDCTLLPTAAHPWMDPLKETRLWRHEYSAIYSAYDRIFNCKGHGWSNLQSTHINLPFSGSREFGRLHAAMRLVLPFIPAIAASSPILELQTHGHLDNRMRFYRTNSAAVPSLTGRVIPEQVFTIRDYHTKIFDVIYADIAPHDPEGVLKGQWLNARGAIARFQRNAIEIRVVDIQECPLADVAIASFISAVVQALVLEELSPYAVQKDATVDELEPPLLDAIREAENGSVTSAEYAGRLGVKLPASATLGDLVAALAHDARILAHVPERYVGTLQRIVSAGTLSTRILKALDGKLDKRSVAEVYAELGDCLRQNRLFRA
jgi:carboxylate-amine ligase